MPANPQAHRAIGDGMLIGIVILIAAMAAAAEAAAADRDVADDRGVRWVYLDRDAEGEGSQLLREMLRQAVLVTAREEFSLQTRDAVLDEPKPEDADAGVVLRVTYSREANDVFLMYVFKEGRRQPLAELRTALSDIPGGDTYDLKDLLETVERWTRQELVDVFKDMGIEHRPRDRHETAPLPDAVREKLGSLNLFEQYVNLRRIHREIEADGESPERLAALSRGYGDLGQLVQFHFNASEFVFYARSLLYAQRLAVGWEPTAERRWARAHAFAMAGLDFAAEADLKAAPLDQADDVPVWVRLVEDLVHHRNMALEQRGEGRDDGARLARYYRFLLEERRGLSHNLATIVRQGERALELAPHALRIIAGITAQGGVSNLHRHGRRGPEALAVRLPRVLAEIDDLPDDLRQLGRQISREDWPSPAMSPLNRRLLSLGDPERDAGEPSLAVLGRLVGESHYYHVFTYGEFVKFRLSAEAASFVDAAMPSIEDHRYAPLFASMSLDLRRQQDQLNELVGPIEFRDVNLSYWPLLHRDRWSWDGRRELWHRLLKSTARNAHDLSRLLVRFQDPPENWLRPRAQQLRAVSPHSPIAIATYLELDWQGIQDELPELKERLRDNAEFLAQLSRAYTKHGQSEEAKPVLQRLITLSGDRKYYAQLAELYLEEGDEERWKETMDRFLAEGDDAGLSRARAAADVAKHYTDTDRPQQAIPYAEQAASTGSAWGMAALSRGYEAAGSYRQSGVWRRRLATRYRGNRIEWYLWCQRTGRGDLQAAAELYREEIERQDADGGQLRDDDLMRRAVFYTLEQEYEKAVPMWQQAFERTSDSWFGLHLAILAHRTGEIELRDRMLERVAGLDPERQQEDREDRPVLIALARAIAPAVQGDQPLPSDALDEQIAQLSARRQMNVNYLFAALLEVAGQEQAAEARLRQAAHHRDMRILNQALAHQALRQRDLDPYAP